MADDDQDRQLLKYARAAATSAEQFDARLEHIGTMSRDGARLARRDVMDALERLQAFEKLLTR
jgi:hypothetical protein